MRKPDKLVILLFLLLFAAMILLFYRMDPPSESDTPEVMPFRVSISTDQGSEIIYPWFDSQETYYVFLPGYALPEQLHIQPASDSFLQIRDASGEALQPEKLQLDEPYSLALSDGSTSGQVIFIQSEGVPSVYVDVQSGSMRYIHALKGNAESGKLRIYSPQGQSLYSGNLESVKGRGNATWDQEKKPYTLSLRAEADILGMGKAEKWLLLPNCLDPSNLRNKLVYDYAKELGMAYTPECQWVDLYLNGNYAGLYLLSEKNQVHSQRIDIPAASGFLVSREKTDRLYEQGLTYISTESGAHLRVHHAAGSLTDLEAQFQSLENALSSVDGRDPATGRHWQDMIDLDSWARKYLIEELFGNLDAGAISQYFYSDGTGIIFAGPVWDFDMSAGNQFTWQIDTANMVYSGRPHLWSLEDSSWYYQLWLQDDFREYVQKLYAQEFRPLLLQYLPKIASYESQIHQASGLNRIRWNYADAAEETRQLYTYMTQRLAFLDSLLLDGETYHTVLIWMNYHITACYMVPHGETIPERTVPGGSDTIIYEGWYDADTDMPFDFSSPITEDTRIYLKETYTNQFSGTAASGLGRIITYVPLCAMVILMLVILLCDRFRQQLGISHSSKTGDAIHERN